MYSMSRLWFFLLIATLLGGFLGVSKVSAQSCGSIRIDRYMCDPPDINGDCGAPHIAPGGAGEVVSCSIQEGQCKSVNFCSSNDTCNPVGGFCGCSQSNAPCNILGPTPTPTPTPTPPPGCGTCNEFASPNNCTNTCSGTACGRCSNGGADCAWGSKNCGGPGPTPTPPSCTLPAAPTLLTPSDNANISGLTASLSWRETLADWGTCPGTLKSFRVFVDPGACTFSSFPNTVQTNTAGTAYNFTGSGGSYCWTVVARKSATVVSPRARPFRTFTLCANSLPAGLALSSPANGSTVGSPVILSWSLTNWGNRCYTSPNRQFKVYLGSNPPPLWSTIINPDIRSTTYSTGTPGSTYYWKVAATNDAWGTSAETPVRSFTLTAPSSSWFQVVGGDVVAATGDISVSGPGVPAGSKFLASPDAAMIYAGNSSGITASQVDGWQVNSALSPSVIQKNSYAKFKIRITNRVVPKNISFLDNLDFSCSAPEADGACYFTSSSALEITLPTQTISKKIVLLIDGDSGNVKVGGNISLSGGGLLVVLAKNNITLAGTVSALQGIYLAQNIFNTGASNTALQVDGTVVGLGSVTLARTLASATQPAEKFIYHPEYITALPTTLWEQHRRWQEFAP